MTTLREAAQQALEALEKSSPQGFYSCKCMGSQHWPHCYWKQHQDAITNLRAALAEQRLTDMEQKMERSIESLKTALAEPVEEAVQEPVAWIQPDHLQKARQAPFLCRVEPTKRMVDFVALYIAPPQRPAEPVQEPDDGVCDGLRGGLCIHQDPSQCKPERDCPAFSAPPQRKPMNEFDALRLITESIGHLQSAGPVEGLIGIIRAVERAHGIT